MMKTFLSVFVTTVCCAGLTFAAQERVQEEIMDGQQDQNSLDPDRADLEQQIDKINEMRNMYLKCLKLHSLGDSDEERYIYINESCDKLIQKVKEAQAKLQQLEQIEKESEQEFEQIKQSNEHHRQVIKLIRQIINKPEQAVTSQGNEEES